MSDTKLVPDTQPNWKPTAAFILAGWTTTSIVGEFTTPPDTKAQYQVSAVEATTHPLLITYHNFRPEKDDIVREWHTPILDVTKAVTELSSSAKDALGSHGVSRLDAFANYPDGWASGEGRALSYLSLAVLDRFLQHFPKFATEPSLFMTRNGTLELAWEASSGDAIQLEFLPDAIEYFFERDNDEGVMHSGRNELKNLSEKLKSLGA